MRKFSLTLLVPFLKFEDWYSYSIKLTQINGKVGNDAHDIQLELIAYLIRDISIEFWLIFNVKKVYQRVAGILEENNVWHRHCWFFWGNSTRPGVSWICASHVCLTPMNWAPARCSVLGNSHRKWLPFSDSCYLICSPLLFFLVLSSSFPLLSIPSVSFLPLFSSSSFSLSRCLLTCT